jgi:hypothetical protein
MDLEHVNRFSTLDDSSTLHDLTLLDGLTVLSIGDRAWMSIPCHKPLMS